MKFYKCPTCRNRVGVGVETIGLPQCANHPKPREMRLDEDHVVLATALINQTVWEWLHSLNGDVTSVQVLVMVDRLREYAVTVPCGRYTSYRITEEFAMLRLLYDTIDSEFEMLSTSHNLSDEQKKFIRSLQNTLVSLESLVSPDRDESESNVD